MNRSPISRRRAQTPGCVSDQRSQPGCDWPWGAVEAHQGASVVAAVRVWSPIPPVDVTVCGQALSELSRPAHAAVRASRELTGRYRRRYADARTRWSRVGTSESTSQRVGGMTGPASGRGYIVVGVDGSDCSKDALRWAARQAEFTSAVVDAIMAWRFPAFYGWAPVDSEDLDFPRFAEQALAHAVDEVFGPDHPDWLRSRVAEGHAAQVLVEASADADLLVVGSRGHGGFTGLLLGSVSTYCVHHARCPVTVVRPRR